MAVDRQQVQAVFLQAVEASPPDRAALLDHACAGNADLRQSVESLLLAHDQSGSFLGRAADVLVQTCVQNTASAADDDPTARIGTVIGPYKLLEPIGEGGMGTVFMAEQTQPVRRKVALKMLKPGMDTRQVIARFEAERQALAIMDHPNIAKILDGGETPWGRPYFVMELVKGVPITKFCDAHRLTPRQRLELFVPVCQAVQHAHQKGVIHRDIKPSNVLVALYDDRPVPKVIDFGVAKAIGQQLTEQTLHTGFGAVVGTVEYMSPEQAGFNQLDVDTRSDIYSLGVLLYELLAGSPPFSRKELETAGMFEMLRLIREQEPKKPSTKLSTAEGLPTLAASRGTEPAKLTRLVRGELDWIVMKALEKDRGRRYETANGLALDVQRYLSDEPVVACPPSMSYRFRKFARRHKAGLATAALVLFFLVLLGGGAGWMLRDRDARRARLTGQLELILDEVNQLQGQQKWPEALAAARRAETLLAGGGSADAALEQQVQQALADLKLVQRLEAIRLEQTAHADPYERFRRAERAYADAFRDAGVDFGRLTEEELVQKLRARPNVVLAVVPTLIEWGTWRDLSGNRIGGRALAIVSHRIDTDPWRHQVWMAFQRIGEVEIRDFVIDMTRLPPAALEGVRALEGLMASPDLTHQPPMTLYLLGMIQSQGMGKPETAVGLFRKAQMRHPGDFWINFGLGWTLRRLGPAHQEEGLAYYRAAVALRPDSPWGWILLGDVLRSRPNQLDEAVACYRKAVELDPTSALAHNQLGNGLMAQKQLGEATARYRKAIELDPTYFAPHYHLGMILRGQGKPDAALDCFRKAIELNPRYADAHGQVGTMLAIQGKEAAALTHLRKAVEVNPKLAWTQSQLAWYLATAADPRLRDPKAAVTHARKGAELQPGHPDRWRNLGVALLRAGELKSAVEMLEKVDAIATGSVHNHRFFLAMAYWHAGDKDKAREAYQQGVEWMDKGLSTYDEQHRFRAEAAELLGVRKE